MPSDLYCQREGPGPEMATSSNTYRGSCLCGDVRFTVEAPTNWCAHCHCTMCQRAHGAAFVTWVGVPEEQLDFLGGEERVRWFSSSDEARRGSCSRCASPLFFRSRRWPAEVHVARAAIPGKIDRPPSGNVYFESHVDWLAEHELPRGVEPAK